MKTKIVCRRIPRNFDGVLIILCAQCLNVSLITGQYLLLNVMSKIGIEWSKIITL